MQDAVWVYYPFKNSHVLHGAVSLKQRQQTVLAQVHELYSRKTNQKKKKIEAQ